MFELNGVSLDDDALGWHLLRGTEPHLPINRRSRSFEGVTDGMISIRPQQGAPVMPLKVRVKQSALEAFMALVNSRILTLRVSGDTKVAVVELLSAATELLPTLVPEVDVSLVLRFNDVSWRDAPTTTSPASLITSASTTSAVMAGISAPVRDATIRVRGSITGLEVSDSGGSSFSYAPNIPSGSYLRFHCDSGRAFVTTSDTWVGGSEVTGQIENGVGPYFFELTPTFTDPKTREVRLTVTSSARAGTPSIQVRGRRAFIV
jgi:hypothetical protein